MSKVRRVFPGLTLQQQQRLQKSIDFWEALPRCEGETAETRERILEGLRAEVNDLLNGPGPIDFNLVESLTFQAALRLSGRQNF